MVALLRRVRRVGYDVQTMTRASYGLFDPRDIPRMSPTTSSASGTVQITAFRQRPHIMSFEGTAEKFIEKHGRGHYLQDGPWASPWPLPLHQLCWQAPASLMWWSA